MILNILYPKGTHLVFFPSVHKFQYLFNIFHSPHSECPHQGDVRTAHVARCQPGNGGRQGESFRDRSECAQVQAEHAHQGAGGTQGVREHAHPGESFRHFAGGAESQGVTTSHRAGQAQRRINPSGRALSLSIISSIVFGVLSFAFWPYLVLSFLLKLSLVF